MRKLIYLLGLAVSIVLSAYTTHEHSDCYQEYIRMSSYYKNLNTAKIYMKYSSVSVLNGEYGEKLVTEITHNENKMRMTNGHITMYQDDKNCVLIAHDRNQIVLQTGGFNKDITAGLSWDKMSSSYHIDTLKKYYNPIQCNTNDGLGHLSLELKDKYLLQSPVKRMAYVYEIKSGKMLKATLDSEVNSTKSREIITIDKFTSNGVAEPFKGTALSQVLSGGTLKESFKKYKLTDVRSN
ncbi:MAG: hypothetical protein K0R51_2560 [Cytophagaceae bacterium]|jgi:hypothetical protein|nr:hypothetical protein [Cytophagaceae bacterium]